VTGQPEAITRPDGRVYRPRKVTANAVVDDDETLSGVLVLGTHDVARAQKLADDYAAWQLGTGHVAVDPEAGWWRDGFDCGRRRWLRDPEAGRAGVWFREIVERTSAGLMPPEHPPPTFLAAGGPF